MAGIFQGYQLLMLWGIFNLTARSATQFTQIMLIFLLSKTKQSIGPCVIICNFQGLLSSGSCEGLGAHKYPHIIPVASPLVAPAKKPIRLCMCRLGWLKLSSGFRHFTSKGVHAFAACILFYPCELCCSHLVSMCGHNHSFFKYHFIAFK